VSINPVNTHLAPSTDPKVEAEKVKKACAEFESLFLSQMLKTMRESGSILTEEEKKDGLGLGTDNPFQDMFDWQLAMKLSMGSPLGIAKQLAGKYLERLEGADPTEGTTPEAKEIPDLRRFIGQPAEPPPERVISRKKNHLPRLDSDIDEIVNDTAKTFNLDPNLIRAVIQAESAGNPRAVSPKGAKGLMQLMDATAADLGVNNPMDPTDNIQGGSAYLRKLLDRYQGNQKLALAAYNAGPGAVDRYGGVPPYPETVTYVRKVLQQMSQHTGQTNPGQQPLDKEK